MGKINILGKAVAEKIAAGEVVERPSSIVKELVENSFDAGAVSVTVEIEKGGTSYIRVTDNGSGIMKEDVEKAFLRHATSKIKDADDLARIGTLGFRGEALCSIGAVSRTTLITKTAAEDVGTYIEVEGGETVDVRDAGCPTGTTVTVKNLFYNTPARMKFLKKDNTESSFVTDICQRAALSHPEVSFRYIRDGKDVFLTPGDSVLKNTVRAVFGKDVSNAMVDVDRIEGKIRVSGLSGENRLSRPNRNMQFFFVNGRLVKSNVLSLALSESYKNELMGGRFAVCVLNVEMPKESVDVNVHPAKTEVKFENDDEVYRAVCLAVKSALVKNAGPREAFPTAAKAFKMPIETKKAEQKKIDVKMFTPIAPKKEEKKPLFTKVETEKPKAEKLIKSAAELPIKETASLAASEVYEPPEEVEPKAEEPKPEPKEEKPEVKIPDFEVVGQLFATYIILETENEMIMIDQHAAHERLNYERIKNDGCMKQVLLMPITLNLSPRERVAWEDNREFFEKMGFEADDFGQNSVIVRTLPSDVDFEDGEALFIETASELIGGGKGEATERRERAIYTIACKAAIKANYALSKEEMKSLAFKALSMEGISTCPHGRPISIKMSKYQIEKMFKRIV
ncbi:MAG: DNA mismatch repair endonuclease MutL [Clostridia bacterium]|nr:DNA mismatch repair endonuclease MutL [Clostridia bacterium]